ncbi:MAG: hypothetical protein M3459_12055 [Actinomycetota bacterium]|nr:hypothetical protein [Actinomycetota bacterium]
MTSRADLLASTEGSNDLEQLPDASPAVRELLDRWARGEATDGDLRFAEQRILAGEPVDQASPGAPRAA